MAQQGSDDISQRLLGKLALPDDARQPLSSLVLSLRDQTVISRNNIQDVPSAASTAVKVWTDAVALAALTQEPAPKMVRIYGQHEYIITGDENYLLFVTLDA